MGIRKGCIGVVEGRGGAVEGGIKRARIPGFLMGLRRLLEGPDVGFLTLWRKRVQAPRLFELVCWEACFHKRFFSGFLRGC